MPMSAKHLLLSLSLVVAVAQWSASQCYPDRHSTNWFDGWVSCQPFPNPNPQHGLSHWIMYDFDQPYKLHEMHVWNTNDPSHLDRGLRNVIVDYSLDGASWTQAGTFTFARGDGTSTYEGFEGPDLAGIQAQYVLLTAVDNHGSASCYGLSEVRFAAEEATTDVAEVSAPSSSCFTAQVYPNPFVERSRLLVQSQCETRVSYRITDLLGRTVDAGLVAGSAGIHDLPIEGHYLAPGSYVLTVRQGTELHQLQLLKID